MKLYKIYSRAIGLLFALSLLCVGCENEDILDINDLEISPSNPESVVIVEPDDGITSVNALTKAINENGDATYILRRDGVYYMEGKYVFKHNVVIKAENGSGKMPIIQPICDAQGALNADMIRLEGSATFENIYIIGKDAATGNLMQRLFRIDESNVRLKFDNCFIDHCRNFCIRTDNVNNKIYLNNSTIRNLALTSDPANGRLIDSRGNEQDSIVINNCYVYNNTAHIVRFDNVVTNYFGIKHSTFYNVGHHIQINYAIKVEIENNIFANVGWKSSAESDVFWQISIPKKDERAQDISMSVCNNNLFFSEEFERLFAKYPQNLKRTTLSDDGYQLIEEGKLTFKDNFSEVLTFDYPPVLPMGYIDKFFENMGSNMSKWADLPFYVDEDGVEGIEVGKTFTFHYSTSSKSATASTTQGPIGASF